MGERNEWASRDKVGILQEETRKMYCTVDKFLGGTERKKKEATEVRGRLTLKINIEREEHLLVKMFYTVTM